MIFLMIKSPNLNGAHDQDRTGDLILTKDVLYRLSYVGWFPLRKRRFPPTPIPVGHASLGGMQPHPLQNGAGNGIRTRDPQLGRLTL